MQEDLPRLRGVSSKQYCHLLLTHFQPPGYDTLQLQIGILPVNQWSCSSGAGEDTVGQRVFRGILFITHYFYKYMFIEQTYSTDTWILKGHKRYTNLTLKTFVLWKSKVKSHLTRSSLTRAGQQREACVSEVWPVRTSLPLAAHYEEDKLIATLLFLQFYRPAICNYFWGFTYKNVLLAVTSLWSVEDGLSQIKRAAAAQKESIKSNMYCYF